MRSFVAYAAQRLTTGLLAIAVPVVIAAAQPVRPPAAPAYELVFRDEFDSLDLGFGNAGSRDAGAHAWSEGVWFNSRHAPSSNFHVSESVLTLKWSKNQGSADTSISTLSGNKQRAQAWRYGYFEARMKWDVATGAWPAFWLIPVQDATGASVVNGVRRSGEIDVFEGIGAEPHTYYGTLHEWVDSKTTATSSNAFPLPRDFDFSQFHTYGVLWVPGKVTWYLDNRPLHSQATTAIFDQQDFFLVLGMQAGVGWRLGDLQGVSAQTFSLNVDWVRVWQRPLERPSQGHRELQAMRGPKH